MKNHIGDVWGVLKNSWQVLAESKTAPIFLIAYWCYIDGVDTIITMAVDYMQSIGASTSNLITAILLVQFVAFPCALIFGRMGHKFGAQRMLLVAVAMYFFITIFAMQLDMMPIDIAGFAFSKIYLFACAVALVQGGIQSLSRSLFATMIEPEHAGQMFGFFNVIGKTATIVGPLLLGTITKLTGNHRYGILSVGLLFLAGFILLLRVRESKRVQSII